MTTPSYNNDRPIVSAEVEYPADPASGGFFQADYKKHDDLKQMLDGSKDSLKLEAMKRIIGMVAKGRDASDLFPAVVKNVVSKNIEVKKLVYVYLVRYAEEQQDLALLSISTFQRALKDPNQLIRAGALRVLSSIRVEMIVPIVMLAIKESASDMSPYVRKTAAHAIPKLYSLDPEQKEELVSVIKKLLSERTIIVIGSAVMAFGEVCPERTDLIHRNFRKLCTLLVDVDEWGQLVILDVLTRYARQNFPDPDAGEPTPSEDERDRPFYDSEDAGGEVPGRLEPHPSGGLDPDQRLLLRSAAPLLQSRNAGVVMAVARLFHHAGPAAEQAPAARALVRLLRGPVEVQSVVLHSIASLTIAKKGTFEPYLKTFFVRTGDPTHVKLLKLEILSNLATEASVPIVLREFQTYITSSDRAFAAATVRAIDRCAADVRTVADACLRGLLDLLSDRDEAVVAESVVVIKKLLQAERGLDGRAITTQLARLLGRLRVGAARAAILWLLGEYRGGKGAPDALRECAKTFAREDDLVKLQVLNLAVKLCLTNPEQTRQLAQYVLTLARYDPSYDIRDRARFLRRFVFPGEGNTGDESQLERHARDLFLATKPAPLAESKFKERQQYTLGSLSQYLAGRAAGYCPLPPFPCAPTAPGLRDTPDPAAPVPVPRPPIKLFFSDTDDSEPSIVSASSGASDSSSEDSSGTEGSDACSKKEKDDSSSTADSSDTSSNGESSQDGSDSESDASQHSLEEPEHERSNLQEQKSNLDLLLELEGMGGGDLLTPSAGNIRTPVSTPSTLQPTLPSPASPSFVEENTAELLSKLAGRGLVVLFRFTRAPHLQSDRLASVELTFTNRSEEEIANITISGEGPAVQPSAPVSALAPGVSVRRILGLEFGDTTRPIRFSIHTKLGESSVSVTPPVGELMRSVQVTSMYFVAEQRRLRGLTQVEGQAGAPGSATEVRNRIFRVANVATVDATVDDSQDILRFAGQTLSSKCLVLVMVRVLGNTSTVTVNCDKMAIGSMLLADIQAALTR